MRSPADDRRLRPVRWTARSGEHRRATGSRGNPVTPDPADSCLTAATPCNTVSFDIARCDNAGMRAIQRDLPAEPELELCTGSLGDIAEGTYLSGVGGTNFQVLDNTGGSYTVDCAILGGSVRGDAATGTLFTVNVKASGVGVVGGHGNHHRDLGDVPRLRRISRFPGPPVERGRWTSTRRRRRRSATWRRRRTRAGTTVGRDDEHRSVLERGDGAGRGHDRDLPRRLRLLSRVRRRGRVGAGDAELSAVGGVDPGGDGGGDARRATRTSRRRGTSGTTWRS